MMNYPKFTEREQQTLRSVIPCTQFFAFLCMFLLLQACQKEAIETTPSQENLTKDETTLIDGQLKNSRIQNPASGGNCSQSIPKAPFWGAGNSAKQSWHRAVKNQWQLINAIKHVNNNGGTIYIDGSFTVTQALPKITRNNVTILSKASNKIYDNIAGGSKASELFRVEGSNFTMKNVTILGLGRNTPGNPNGWAGKRSAVAVTKNTATFDRVFIRYYTHAAIRLEFGSGHKVINSTLTNQNKSSLGYGVLLRNNARNVLIKRNRFDANSHSVATTGGIQQSYRAEGNWSTNATKWHFDVHMGPDNWGGNKVEIINNVTNGGAALLVVRGPFTDGVYIRNNLYNKGAGDLIKIKPDRYFRHNGTNFNAGIFYGPFFAPGTARNVGRAFFNKGEIKNNCIFQNFNNLLNRAPR